VAKSVPPTKELGVDAGEADRAVVLGDTAVGVERDQGAVTAAAVEEVAARRIVEDREIAAVAGDAGVRREADGKVEEALSVVGAGHVAVGGARSDEGAGAAGVVVIGDV